MVVWASLLVRGMPSYFVEALLRRLAAIRAIAAEMPFAEKRRGISDRLQCLGDGHLHSVMPLPCVAPVRIA